MVRALVLESRLRGLARVTHHLVHDGERQVVLEELTGVLTANILGFNLRNLNDLQAGSAHTVAGRHFLVERIDSSVHRRLTVLLVGVVVARAGLVTDPDAEVLHSRRVGFKDLRVAKNPMSEQRMVSRRTLSVCIRYHYSPHAPSDHASHPRASSSVSLSVVCARLALSLGLSEWRGMRTHLVAGDDLAVRLLNLLEARHEIPVHIMKHRARSVPVRNRARSLRP